MSNKKSGKQTKKEKIIYRRAEHSDLEDIRIFVDYWLAGRAKLAGIENAGNDYFVTTKQHQQYIKNCVVLLAFINKKMVGWAVKERNNVLIHLLIDATQRGKGIGRTMLKELDPDIIRSKSDQQTGNPAGFYEKYGYILCGTIQVGKKRNIDLMMKDTSK